MVIPYVPRSSNPDNPCEALEAFEAQRPPRPQTLIDANMGLFVYTVIVWSGSLAGHWYYRNTPRFRKVRPFALSAVLIFGLIMYHAASNLMYVFPMPCALVVLLYLMSMTLVIAFPTIRLLAIVLETRYAFLTSRDGANNFDREVTDLESEMVYGGPVERFLRKFVMFVRVLIQPSHVDVLTVEDIVWIKNAYVSLVFIYTLPAALTYIVLLALVPPFQTCRQCAIYLELPITLFTVIPVYVFVLFVMAWEAFKKVKWDDKGLIAELIQVPLVTFPIAVIVWLLMIFDPNDLEVRNQFNWSILATSITVTWFIASYGYQFYFQFSHSRAVKGERTFPTMSETFDAHPGAKKAFYEFAEKQYIIESLLFLDDIKTFKHFFFEKADTWKVAKFKSLCEAFVLSGSRMEINVSHTMRSKIVARHDQLKRSPSQVVVNDLFGVFDEAFEDVNRMIHNGAWVEFLRRRPLRTSLVAATASLRAFANGRVEPMGGI